MCLCALKIDIRQATPGPLQRRASARVRAGRGGQAQLSSITPAPRSRNFLRPGRGGVTRDLRQGSRSMSRRPRARPRGTALARGRAYGGGSSFGPRPPRSRSTTRSPSRASKIIQFADRRRRLQGLFVSRTRVRKQRLSHSHRGRQEFWDALAADPATAPPEAASRIPRSGRPLVPPARSAQARRGMWGRPPRPRRGRRGSTTAVPGDRAPLPLPRGAHPTRWAGGDFGWSPPGGLLRPRGRLTGVWSCSLVDGPRLRLRYPGGVSQWGVSRRIRQTSGSGKAVPWTAGIRQARQPWEPPRRFWSRLARSSS